jgi:hypothetical protein
VRRGGSCPRWQPLLSEQGASPSVVIADGLGVTWLVRASGRPITSCLARFADDSWNGGESQCGGGCRSIAEAAARRGRR